MAERLGRHSKRHKDTAEGNENDFWLAHPTLILNAEGLRVCWRKAVYFSAHCNQVEEYVGICRQLNRFLNFFDLYRTTSVHLALRPCCLLIVCWVLPSEYQCCNTDRPAGEAKANGTSIWSGMSCILFWCRSIYMLRDLFKLSWFCDHCAGTERWDNSCNAHSFTQPVHSAVWNALVLRFVLQVICTDFVEMLCSMRGDSCCWVCTFWMFILQCCQVLSFSMRTAADHFAYFCVDFADFCWIAPKDSITFREKPKLRYY